MKGKISDRLRMVLEHKDAREQLRKILIQGNDGTVSVNQKVYAVRVDASRAPRTAAAWPRRKAG
jgi:hypothetical protein